MSSFPFIAIPVGAFVAGWALKGWFISLGLRQLLDAMTPEERTKFSQVLDRLPGAKKSKS